MHGVCLVLVGKSSKVVHLTVKSYPMAREVRICQFGTFGARGMVEVKGDSTSGCGPIGVRWSVPRLVDELMAVTVSTKPHHMIHTIRMVTWPGKVHGTLLNRRTARLPFRSHSTSCTKSDTLPSLLSHPCINMQTVTSFILHNVIRDGNAARYCPFSPYIRL